MAQRAAIVRHVDPAEPQGTARAEPVRVVADANAKVGGCYHCFRAILSNRPACDNDARIGDMAAEVEQMP
jgi:hypothetical protein